jgi:hypothetical protein
MPTAATDTVRSRVREPTSQLTEQELKKKKKKKKKGHLKKKKIKQSEQSEKFSLFFVLWK